MDARTKKALVIAALLSAVPLMLLLDTARALVMGWWRTSDIFLAVIGPAAIAVAAVALLLATKRGRELLVRRGRQLVLLECTLLFGWLAAEVAVGAVLGGSLWFHRKAPHLETSFHPKPGTMLGIHGEARYTTNSLGMRGPELPADREALRLLCVGGSTTACLYLDDEETWPQLLRAKLAELTQREVWAADVGQSGFGSWHHVRFLDGYGDLADFDCIVVLVGINDFRRAIAQRDIDTSRARPLWESSGVLATLRNIHQARKEARRRKFEQDRLARMEAAPVAASGDIAIEKDGSHIAARRAIWQKGKRLVDLPDLTASLDQFATNVRSMARIARAAGTRIVFLGQPYLWDEDGISEAAELLCWFANPDGSSPTIEKMAEGMRRFNERLAAVCDELGVPFVDLSAMNGKLANFYDDCHFSEAGAREVARLTAAALVRARVASPRPGVTSK